jgi:hypothetical protein
MAPVSRSILHVENGRSIEPDLKQFIDECLVPLLVRDALADLQSDSPGQNFHAPELCGDDESGQGEEH